MNLLFEIENHDLPNIQGLQYIPDFINEDEERALISQIDQQPWLNDLKRRVQHYGYKYDYKARAVTNDSYIGGLPPWLNPVSDRLHQEDLFEKTPDQAIVNEYLPSQGISAHTDCVPCFDNAIASLSLGSPAIMQFTHAQAKQKEELYLKPRSLVILSGEARYEWQHAIPARKSDVVNGFKIERDRRISVTFRNII